MSTENTAAKAASGDRVAQALQGPAQEWQNWALSAVSERVQDALRGPKANMPALIELLREAFQEGLVGLPAEVRNAMI
jgi:hypothetical protein